MRQGSAWSRWGRRRVWLSALGAAVFVLSATELSQHYHASGGPGMPVALTAVRFVPLLLAWRLPYLAAALPLATVAGTALALTPVSAAEPWPWPVSSTGLQAALLIMLGLRGSHDAGRRRTLIAGAWLVSQLGGVVAILAAPDRGGWIDLATPAVLLTAAAVVAELVGARAELARDAAAQRRTTDAERVRRTQLEERARLARELHDVVAHHLSVVVARADSAPVRLGDVPDPARAEFAAIADEARASLTEMRRVLRLLREQRPDRPHPPAPQPGLADLEALIDGVRASGAQIVVDEQLPASDDLPPIAQLTAYRVVQEALTNAIRHAPGAPITVRVRRSDGRLDVRVTNGPSAEAGPAGIGAGQGLRGLVERVDAAGGRAQAHPLPGGGFSVDADLPIETR